MKIPLKKCYFSQRDKKERRGRGKPHSLRTIFFGLTGVFFQTLEGLLSLFIPRFWKTSSTPNKDFPLNLLLLNTGKDVYSVIF